MTQVRVLLFGGTIAMGGSGGVVPREDVARDLLGGAAVPDVDVVASVVRTVGSSRMTFDDVMDAARTAREAVLVDGAAGAVVVQGTDTLEEVAYLLDLVWDLDAPLVVTGAMRHADAPGADGPANLAAAVATAASEAARGRGVLVVMADEVHAAAHVAKTHASAPQACASPATGPLGTMLEGRPVLHLRADRPAPLPLPEPGTMPRDVALWTCSLDEDPGLLRALGAAASGLVVGAFGVGHVNPATADALEEIAARIPVVLCSRTGAGSVHASTYGGPGNEADLLARGLVNGGRLRPVQARARLALLLALKVPAADLPAAFA